MEDTDLKIKLRQMIPQGNKSIIIRPFRPEDRAVVRHICYETSFLERPQLFIQDPDIVADVLTAYSTDYEPEECLVAECDGGVVGYLVGTRDLNRMNQVFFRKMLMPLLWRTLKRGVFLKAQAWQFLWSALKCVLKGDFRFPDFSRQYPASLHINVNKEFHGLNIGKKLIEHYLNHLKTQKVPGVLVSVMTKQGRDFFLHNDFQVLVQTTRSLFCYRLGFDIPQYLLGKKIASNN